MSTREALAGVVVAACSLWAHGAESRDPMGPAKTLLVGTRHVPPFAIKGDEGTWSGITIDLWRDLAADLGLKFEFREVDLKAMLQGVERKSLDAAAAALTVTAAREEVMDFTHPFHTTGLSIAVVPGKRKGWTRVLRRFFSWDFLKAVAALAVVLLATGFLVWLFERGRNREQFDHRVARGLGAGFWWSAVTMTTVGYGDKAPRTFGGRLVALVWMFAALVIIAAFTGAIASALTVGQLEAAVHGPEDLARVRVGTVEGSTSEAYLRGRRIACRTYRTARDGLEAVAGRSLDAFVYDSPLLRYLANTEFRGKVEVLPRKFERQDYAIALTSDNPLREPLNRALLRRIGSPQWQETLSRYLGE